MILLKRPLRNMSLLSRTILQKISQSVSNDQDFCSSFRDRSDSCIMCPSNDKFPWRSWYTRDLRIAAAVRCPSSLSLQKKQAMVDRFLSSRNRNGIKTSLLKILVKFNITNNNCEKDLLGLSSWFHRQI